MRLQTDPRLPMLGSADYDQQLYRRLYDLFRDIATAHNQSLSVSVEGIEAKTLDGALSELLARIEALE